MKPPFLRADAAHPVVFPDGSTHTKTVFLNRVIDHPNIQIGDYTYYSDFDEVTEHAVHIAPYLFAGSRERLIIGKFCQIAHGSRFITASANHPMGGFSTYPFSIFNPDTMDAYGDLALQWGDTVIGNDVWIGYGATILPGVTIGNGAIIGAKSVVARDVGPYEIVGGNPARIIRPRFDAKTIGSLQRVCWWDWPIDHIQTHRGAIEGADIAALEAAFDAVGRG